MSLVSFIFFVVNLLTLTAIFFSSRRCWTATRSVKGIGPKPKSMRSGPKCRERPVRELPPLDTRHSTLLQVKNLLNVSSDRTCADRKNAPFRAARQLSARQVSRGFTRRYSAFDRGRPYPRRWPDGQTDPHTPRRGAGPGALARGQP